MAGVEHPALPCNLAQGERFAALPERPLHEDSRLVPAGGAGAGPSSDSRKGLHVFHDRMRRLDNLRR